MVQFSVAESMAIIPAMDSIELVWFRQEDYAPLARRLAACIIDNVVVIAGLFALPWLLSKMLANPPTTQPAHKLAPVGLLIAAAVFWAVIAIPYHLGMRRTRNGTIGYRLMGIRIISMHNAIPDLGVLIRRLLLALIIPAAFFVLMAFSTAASAGRPATHTQPAMSATRSILNLVMLAIVLSILFANYWSIPRSHRRQAQHDRFSGTWVIRANAEPAGIGVPVERAWIVGPVVLAYWDVDPAPLPQSSTGVTEEASA